MKILIIGSEGYVGSYLYTSLISSHTVTGVDHKDTTRKTLVFESENGINQYTKDFIQSFDVCIYLAGRTTRNMKEEQIRDNIDDISYMASLLLPSQLLIYSSTTAVYEECENASESTDIHEDKLDFYSLSMLMRERQIQTISNIRTIGLRLGTIVGISPKQRSDRLHIQMLKSSLFTGLIHVQHPFGLRPILSFVDLQNCIELILTSFDQHQGHQIYNICSYNTTISCVASAISLKTDSKCIYHDSENRRKGFSCSSNKFETQFNYKFISTNESIIDELIQSKTLLIESWKNPIEQTLPCLVCGETFLMEMINLHSQPLANQFVKREIELERYPLAMYRCNNCYHHQLNHIIPPEQLFTDYIYVSGTTETGNSHFTEFCKYVIKDTNVEHGTVLELASNDGTQLDKFKASGWKTYGVDPAKNLEPLATAKGHSILVGFWGDPKITDQLNDIQFDAIIAQNVFAHVPNPAQFLNMCKVVMNEKTKLYIQTSQAEIFEHGEFDTIYHEHISFFTVKSMLHLSQRCDLHLETVRKVPIHGTSYIFELRKREGSSEAVSQNVLDMIQKESEIYQPLNPIFYREHAMEKTRILKSMIGRLHDDGFVIAGYGAAAKGNTLLNFIYPDNSTTPLEYIVDENLMKQNLYTPGTRIKVVGPDILKDDYRSVAVLVLAWNFLEEIQKKILMMKRKNNTVLCVPFPDPSIYLLTNGTWERMSEFKLKSDIKIQPCKVETVLITHFYNEELLLPYWINHHASMFDHVILIDYNSTDKSNEIISRYAPSNWKVIKSKNTNFDANLVDQEVRSVEKSFPDHMWRLTLTITEFLVWPTMKHDLEDCKINCMKIQALNITGDDNVPLVSDLPLVQQRACFALTGQDYSRYIHKYTNNIDRLYLVGRHTININWISPKNGMLFKYIYSPWPEILPRKLQIAPRQPISDIIYQLGLHHQVTKEKMIEDKKWSLTLIEYDIFKETRTSDQLALLRSRMLHEQLQLPWSVKVQKFLTLF